MSGNLFTRWPSVILSAFGLAMVCDLHAQHIVPSVEWERLYADEACDFYQVTEASDQGFVLSGRIFDEAAQAMRYDNSVVKVDGRGSVQWTKVYGGTGNESTRSLHKTTDGGYILASYSDSVPSGSKDSLHFGQNDVWVVKVDAEGREQWERSIGGSGDDTPIHIWQSVDDGYLLAAILPGAVGGPYYWLTKLNAQGQTEWERPLGDETGNSLISLFSVNRAADGGYALVGVSRKDPFGESDGWVMKVDAEGKKQWEDFFGGTEDEIFFSSDETADGGFILGGRSSSPPSGNKESPNYDPFDYWLVKVDAAGKKQWDRSYTNTVSGAVEEVRSVRQTTDQGFIFGGNSQLIKADSNGNPQWNKALFSHEFPNPPYLYDVDIKDLRQTKDGGYILTGSLLMADGSTGGACHTGGWAAKLENVVSRSGEVVTWKTSPDVVLESVETLDAEWSINRAEVLSIGGASAISLVPAGQQRYYRLQAAGGPAELPSLSLATLLSWPVDQNQALEFSASKDGSWATFLGDWGSVGATNYAIVTQSLRQHYFRTKKRE